MENQIAQGDPFINENEQKPKDDEIMINATEQKLVCMICDEFLQLQKVVLCDKQHIACMKCFIFLSQQKGCCPFCMQKIQIIPFPIVEVNILSLTKQKLLSLVGNNENLRQTIQCGIKNKSIRILSCIINGQPNILLVTRQRCQSVKKHNKTLNTMYNDYLIHIISVMIQQFIENNYHRFGTMGIEYVTIPYADNISVELILDWQIKECTIVFHNLECVYNKEDNAIQCGDREAF